MDEQQISIPTPPEPRVALADLEDGGSIDAFGAELIDRFGPLPEEVEHLLKIVTIKALCRKTNVEKIDAGPKGIVIGFRDGRFDNPAALVQYIGEQGSLAKIRPDQKIVLTRDWPEADQRLKGTAAVLLRLGRMVEEARKGANVALKPVEPPVTSPWLWNSGRPMASTATTSVTP